MCKKKKNLGQLLGVPPACQRFHDFFAHACGYFPCGFPDDATLRKCFHNVHLGGNGLVQGGVYESQNVARQVLRG